MMDDVLKGEISSDVQETLENGYVVVLLPFGTCVLYFLDLWGWFASPAIIQSQPGMHFTVSRRCR